jgi:uroporphyrin-III C-methyltransferase
MKTKGKVYLVGAGPGDIELLTIKGLRLIRQADVIYYDSLMNKDILKEAKPTCNVIFCGKRCGNAEMTQEEINKSLVKSALEGHMVIRLKGGDPFVFGRGGEEILTLKFLNIPFEVIPGVSSSVAGPAYAGIPLTHRNVSTSFAVITGHEAPDKENSQVEWGKIIGIQTLVFLMAITNRKKIAYQLLNHGRSADEPVAFIENATLPTQKVIRTTLIRVATEDIEVKTPALMIIGDVVNLDLSWFAPKNHSAIDQRVLEKTFDREAPLPLPQTVLHVL